MSKKKNNTKKILAVGIIGVGVYLMLSKPKTIYVNYPQAPYAPTNSLNVQQWQSWINTVISIYGTARELWAPGGPFYKDQYSSVVEDLLPNYDDYA